VGRERELATLLAHFVDAEAGRGRITFWQARRASVRGRLLAEVAARAAGRGAQVFAGRCLEGSGALPFHPFVEAIETFLQGRPPPPGAIEQLLNVDDVRSEPALQPDELRLRLLDGVARFLAGRTIAAPAVLLVDDVHWLTTLRWRCCVTWRAARPAGACGSWGRTATVR
jgi:hypothetical protein